VGEGFPKAARLKRSVEFKRIQQTGLRFHTQHFIVCACKASSSPSRFGLTVSRKVGNAVTRNRVKRLLRESVRKSRAGFERYDVVFIAKPSSARALQTQVTDQVQFALSRLERGGQ
jgi:ribonuclease P protein component